MLISGLILTDYELNIFRPFFLLWNEDLINIAVINDKSHCFRYSTAGLHRRLNKQTKELITLNN